MPNDGGESNRVSSDAALFEYGFDELLLDWFDYIEKTDLVYPEIQAGRDGSRGVVYMLDKRPEGKDVIIGGTTGVSFSGLEAETPGEFETLEEAASWWTSITKELFELQQDNDEVVSRLNGTIDVNQD